MAAPARGREPRARQPPQGRAGTRSAGRRRRPCRDRTGARTGRRRVRVRRRTVPQGRVAADARHPFGGHRRGARRSERRRGSGRERARSGADRFAPDRRGGRRSPTSLGSSRGRGTLPRSISAEIAPAEASKVDLAEVRGQAQARRALEVAAAGGHNLLMIGPPGAGKTMLARRLATILPELSREEALEATQLHSVAGLLDRPRRAHDASVPRAPSLGVDRRSPRRRVDVPASGRGEPGPSRRALLGRAHGVPARRPRRPAAAPRGRSRRGDPRCGLGRVPGPVHAGRRGQPVPVRVRRRSTQALSLSGGPGGAVPAEAVRSAARPHRPPSAGASSHQTRAVGVGAWGAERRGSRPGAGGSRTTAASVRGRSASRATRTCRGRSSGAMRRSRPEAEELLASAVEALALTGRGFDRALKVARTVADLAGAPHVEADHLAEALSYREGFGEESLARAG